ncbi:MAG: OmpA family protein [Telluria sp.]
MASSLAVLLPVALAVHTGWQQHKTCTGEPYAKPVAENFCSGLRQTLNESCTAMLSVPLGQVSLGIGETITPVKFDEFTKETIRETYGACIDFWDGTGGFPEYQRRLSVHASVLNLLFAKLPPSLAKQNKAVQENLAGLGASSSAMSVPSVQKAVEATCQKLGNCGPAAPSDGEPAPGTGTSTTPQQPKSPDDPTSRPDDLARLRTELETSLATHETNMKSFVTAELEKMKAQLPKPAVTAGHQENDAPARLVAEVTFATGDATLGAETCAALAEPVKAALKPDGAVLVTAYADYRGNKQDNLTLSQRRADKVAACLVKGLVLPSAKVNANGAGILWTVPADARTARKASIYVRE